MPADLIKVINKLEEAQELKPFKKSTNFRTYLITKRKKQFNNLMEAFEKDLVLIQELIIGKFMKTYECLEYNLKNFEEQENINVKICHQ